MNAPWGMALAPFNFGRFSDDILIGNFGVGRINAYRSESHVFPGQLSSPSGKAITTDGRWSLTFGGALACDPGTLYFDAGPNGEKDGLFGTLTPQQWAY